MPICLCNEENSHLNILAWTAKIVVFLASSFDWQIHIISPFDFIFLSGEILIFLTSFSHSVELFYLLVLFLVLFLLFSSLPGSDSSMRGWQPVHGDHPEAPEELGHPHPVHDQGVQSLWDVRSHSSGGIKFVWTIYLRCLWCNEMSFIFSLYLHHCFATLKSCACRLQENRIGKAVEVMIQHVENLRRMYTKEHTELLELREMRMQNERSFGSHTERGEACRTRTWHTTYYQAAKSAVASASELDKLVSVTGIKLCWYNHKIWSQ